MCYDFRMDKGFTPGDFLVFQIEAGYGLLRLLAVSEIGAESVWHLAAYDELFLDVEFAEIATRSELTLKTKLDHVALTDRAFESTQVAKIESRALNDTELIGFEAWKNDEKREVSDRSIRLLLGLR